MEAVALLFIFIVSISSQCTRLGQIEDPASSGGCICNGAADFVQVASRN